MGGGCVCLESLRGAKYRCRSWMPADGGFQGRQILHQNSTGLLASSAAVALLWCPLWFAGRRIKLRDTQRLANTMARTIVVKLCEVLCFFQNDVRNVYKKKVEDDDTAEQFIANGLLCADSPCCYIAGITSRGETSPSSLLGRFGPVGLVLGPWHQVRG